MNTASTQSRTRAEAPVLDCPRAGVPLASEAPLPNGSAAGAILAAGIGAACLGVIVTCAEAFLPVAKALIFSTAVGPLSGKTTVAMVAWMGIWMVLHWRWRRRHIHFPPVAMWTVVCVTVGLLGTFPPVYEFVAKCMKGYV